MKKVKVLFALALALVLMLSLIPVGLGSSSKLGNSNRYVTYPDIYTGIVVDVERKVENTYKYIPCTDAMGYMGKERVEVQNKYWEITFLDGKTLKISNLDKHVEPEKMINHEVKFILVKDYKDVYKCYDSSGIGLCKGVIIKSNQLTAVILTEEAKKTAEEENNNIEEKAVSVPEKISPKENPVNLPVDKVDEILPLPLEEISDVYPTMRDSSESFTVYRGHVERASPVVNMSGDSLVIWKVEFSDGRTLLVSNLQDEVDFSENRINRIVLEKDSDGKTIHRIHEITSVW